MRNKWLLGLCLAGTGLTVLLLNRAPWSARSATGPGLESPNGVSTAAQPSAGLAAPGLPRAAGEKRQATEGLDALPLAQDASQETAGDYVDRSGMTQAEKIRTLLQTYDYAGRTPEFGRLHGQFSLAGRCVITILRARGLADYGDPAELERLGGFSLRSSSSDEWVIAADRARFAFPKGLFPIYDKARERVYTEPINGRKESFSEAELKELDYLFQDALAALGVPITDPQSQSSTLR